MLGTLARASRRAASASGPTSARTKSPRLPAVKRPRSTTQQTAIKSPESPPVRLDRRQQNNQTCHETTFSDALLPAVGPSPSKKSLKRKTLYADSDHQPPEIAQIADISAKICHSLPSCKETLYPITQPLCFQRSRQNLIEPPGSTNGIPRFANFSANRDEMRRLAAESHER